MRPDLSHETIERGGRRMGMIMPREEAVRLRYKVVCQGRRPSMAVMDASHPLSFMPPPPTFFPFRIRRMACAI